MTGMKLKHYTDPGHGWVAVKRNLLVELGILEKITSYSYQKGQTVYLEEDCDYTTLVETLKTRGITVELIEKYTNNRSPIRSYPSFVA